MERNKLQPAPATPMSRTPEQEQVTAFLATPGVVGDGTLSIHETHIARVFVAGPRAFKIKRPVKLAFLDFSTLEKRHSACLSELAVNRDNAPQIYHRVVAITREADGRLAIGGSGTPVEWAVEMRAFRQSDLLSERAAKGPLPETLVKQTADTVYAMHGRAAPNLTTNPVAKMRSIVAEVAEVCRAQSEVLNGAAVERWTNAALANITQHEPLLRGRARTGSVRRCHGDLHLANIVVWKEQPILFDALEFSEEMATVDTLYDLAFLLMDLVQHKQRPAANTILNRYIWRAGSSSFNCKDPNAPHAETGEVANCIGDIAGLELLPLFLSCRAGIRAMVEAMRAATPDTAAATHEQRMASARNYLDTAILDLTPPPAQIIAIGGLSGTGKSTLAAALAPQLGGAAGALHFRSDMERKAMFGVGETDRLPPGTYTPETSAKVYERVFQRASAAIAAGQCVIVDAVFANPNERAQIARIAAAHGVLFKGLWLAASRKILRQRVDQRTGDASDATSAVVERQLSYDIGELDPAWTKIEAGGAPSVILARAATWLNHRTA